jgi:hypothetical protein
MMAYSGRTGHNNNIKRQKFDGEATYYMCHVSKDQRYRELFSGVLLISVWYIIGEEKALSGGWIL